MKIPIPPSAPLVAAVIALSAGCRSVEGERELELFQSTDIALEQNVTDGDAEVVIEIVGGDDGFAHLEVVTPESRTVVELLAGSEGTLGMRELLLESPEPGLARVVESFPEGSYVFRGRTLSDRRFLGLGTLSHDLLEGVASVRPGPGATVPPGVALEVSWDPVDGAAGYRLELESDDAEVELCVALSAATTSFTIPAQLLVPAAVYELAIAVENAPGNITVVESAFSTSV